MSSIFHVAGLACVAFLLGCSGEAGAPSEPSATPRPVMEPLGGKEVTNSIGMKLVLIPAGEFLMGSPEDEAGRDEDELQHRVLISKPFYLGVTEVTQTQFEAIMGFNPSRRQGNPRCPVECVPWDAAVEFCSRLSEREGRDYRLPTEAQWEYACRAGTTSRFWFGDDPAELHLHANYCDASSTLGLPFQDLSHNDGHDGTAPVGSYRPNPWGLYDMHGNVREWCADSYGEDYYERSPETDPEGPQASCRRVVRSGTYLNDPKSCRSADRSLCNLGHDSLGFRVALVLGE